LRYFFLSEITWKEKIYGSIYDVFLSCIGDFLYRYFYLDTVYTGKFYQTDIMCDFTDPAGSADVFNTITGEQHG